MFYYHKNLRPFDYVRIMHSDEHHSAALLISIDLGMHRPLYVVEDIKANKSYSGFSQLNRALEKLFEIIEKSPGHVSIFDGTNEPQLSEIIEIFCTERGVKIIMLSDELSVDTALPFLPLSIISMHFYPGMMLNDDYRLHIRIGGKVSTNPRSFMQLFFIDESSAFNRSTFKQSTAIAHTTKLRNVIDMVDASIDSGQTILVSHTNPDIIELLEQKSIFKEVNMIKYTISVSKHQFN